MTGGLTTQTITGFTALGRKASAPQYQNPWVYNPRMNLSLQRGRISEVLARRWESLNFQSGTMLVERAVVNGRIGTPSSNRVVL